jgi:membrane peptidoglycan carboxypeptidase
MTRPFSFLLLLLAPGPGDGHYRGSIPYFYALANSLNIPAAKVGQSVGLEAIAELLHRVGFAGEVPLLPALTLGAFEATPLAVTQAMLALARLGQSERLHSLREVRDVANQILFKYEPVTEEILDPVTTSVLVGMMKTSFDIGTAKGARGMGIAGAFAGKTGTTDNERNVWFVGYVPQLAAAVWVGDDSNRALGKGITGGHYAAPIWRDFMAQALKNEPVLQFPDPAKFPRPKVK